MPALVAPLFWGEGCYQLMSQYCPQVPHLHFPAKGFPGNGPILLWPPHLISLSPSPGVGAEGGKRCLGRERGRWSQTC